MLYYLRAGSNSASVAGFKGFMAFWLGGACAAASSGGGDGGLPVFIRRRFNRNIRR